MINIFRKNIYSLYFYLNEILGIKIFNNLNTFTINLYNFLYRILILDLKKVNVLHDFFSKGFQVIGKANQDYIEKINFECNKQLPKNYNNETFKFKITNETIHYIKKIIQESCYDHLVELEKCHRSKIKLSWVGISRNYHSSKDEEIYNNYFHTDGYNRSLIKLFINLHDVNSDHGALQIVKKINAKKFIKDSKKNLKARRIKPYLNKEEEGNYVFVNQGKKGSILIANTSELIHRAGNPKKGCFRDIIFLEFIAIPSKLKNDDNFFSLEKEYKNTFLCSDNWFSKKIAKPKSVKGMIRQLIEYKKNII